MTAAAGEIVKTGPSGEAVPISVPVNRVMARVQALLRDGER